MEAINWHDRESAKKATRLLQLLSGQWRGGITWIAIFRFAASFAASLQLIFIAELIAGMVLKPIRKIDFVFGLLYLSLAAIGRVLFHYLADRAAARLTEKITVSIRTDMLSSIVAGGIPFLKKELSGSISLSFGNKADALAPYFSRYIPHVLVCVTLPLVILVYLFFINWVCGLLMLLTAPAIPVFMMIIGRGTEAKSKEQWQTLSRMGGDFLDRLRGVTTLYLLGQLKNQSEKVSQSSRLYAQSVLSVLKIAFLSSAVLEFFSAVIIAGAAVYIGLNMMHYMHLGPASSYSLQNGLVILLLIPEFIMSLKTLGNYYHDRTRAIGAVMGLRDSGFLQEETPVASEAAPKTHLHKAMQSGFPPPIVFHNVRFSYNGRQNILEAFNLVIEPYEKVRIMGANGSGKTTVLSLLLGWYQPDEGYIGLGDYAIKQYQETELFRTVSWIGQRTAIFQGTIRSNILMGTALPDKELWEEVLEPVALVNYIQQLPSGLDTVVAEDGKSISGGERQKIALARALVKGTPILLLDEPLAHLDVSSSSDFLDTLNKIAVNKTIIMTGHGESYHRMEGYREINLHATTE